MKYRYFLKKVGRSKTLNQILKRIKLHEVALNVKEINENKCSEDQAAALSSQVPVIKKKYSQSNQ